jgi:hypothetical protein
MTLGQREITASAKRPGMRKFEPPKPWIATNVHLHLNRLDNILPKCHSEGKLREPLQEFDR